MSALNSLHNAVSEVKPLLHIHQYSAEAAPWIFQQTGDMRAVLRAITPYVYYLRNPLDAENMTKAAIDAARQQRVGVALLVEENLWPCAGVARNGPFYQSEWPRIPAGLEFQQDADADGIAIDALRNMPQVKLLVILAGFLDRASREAAARFLERGGLPYVSTFKSRLAFPSGVGQYYGVVGTLGRHTANYALRHARHVLVLGPDEGGLGGDTFYGRRFLAPSSFINPQASFTQITSAITHGATQGAFLELPKGQSTHNMFVRSLARVLDVVNCSADDIWVAALEHARRALAVTPLQRTSSLLEKYVARAASVHAALRPEDAPSVLTGVGNHWYAVGKYMNVQHPGMYYSPTNWGSIGVGVPNGLGMHFATGKPVWVFEGDGGAAFAAASYAYLLANTHLPLTVTLFMDAAYSAVQTSQYICLGEQRAVGKVPVPAHDQVEANISKMLDGPSVHRFWSSADYESFLAQAPTATGLRVLLVHFPLEQEEDGNSMVYEINVTRSYVEALVSSDFPSLRRAQGVIFTEPCSR
uniref:Thiamine pyrophosphate enzyme TPP-binding domain-containing protein n=1 Tax=Zooxanthella nutricula TaxID=1333877 RepID=A0A6U9WN29_9DINO|mmetsp:Transcript_30670/g.92790  ORF Transcript_30670/g.92790 Transcript_30670/m.92790 type:complete len:529 (+) Transcript_30670:521-2107(+)